MQASDTGSRAQASAPSVSKGEADGGQRGERAGTLVRGLAILEVLVAATQPMSLGEVAQACGLDQSTVHRLLRTLEEGRYVVRNGETRRYSPSPKLLHPLPLLHPLNQLRRECAPVLAELALHLRKTVVLVLFIGWERLVVDIAQIAGSLTPYYGTWLQGPLHATAGGKALLMSVDAQLRRAILGEGPLEAITPQTLTDLGPLNVELDASARRGYVLSREEHRAGVTNLAANIRNWGGSVVGCLIVTGHAREMDDATCATLGDELKRAAELFVYQAPSLEAASRIYGR
ncbi:MAG: IclR family transcriptional regulator [Burkholderiaceae bacterium]|nr:IclR family transcriptional regulator [Burkholderiaceae bacterium]